LKKIVEKEGTTLNHEKNKSLPICFPHQKDLLPISIPNFKGKKPPFINLTKKLKNEKNEIESSKRLDDFVNLNDQQNKITFNIFEYLQLIFKIIFRRKKDFKEQLFLKAEEVFENELDLGKMLKRVQDIEKLKYLLLNENQIALFDVLEKPMIFVDEKMTKKQRYSMIISHQTAMNDKMHQAFEFYQNLETKKNLNSINKKLFDLVHDKFQTYKKYFK